MFLLLVLVVVLAAVGGFLGSLLEVAAWLIVALAIAGAVVGYFLHRAFQNFKSKHP